MNNHKNTHLSKDVIDWETREFSLRAKISPMQQIIYMYLVFSSNRHMKRLNKMIVVYMDTNSETTEIKVYSSETIAFDETPIKHVSCTHTWQCKQVLYVQIAPCGAPTPTKPKKCTDHGGS